MKPHLIHKPESYWLHHPACSGVYRGWLIDEGSLTRRLQSCCKNFSVSGVRQAWSRPLPDEAAVLGLRRGATALIREVWLQDGNTRLVFARSVLPRSSLRGVWRDLGRLGSKPLGAALFADAQVVRWPLAFRKMAQGRSMWKTDLTAVLWARRSIFARDGRKILVTEAFLPEVLHLEP